MEQIAYTPSAASSRPSLLPVVASFLLMGAVVALVAVAPLLSQGIIPFWPFAVAPLVLLPMILLVRVIHGILWNAEATQDGFALAAAWTDMEISGRVGINPFVPGARGPVA